MAPFDKSHDFLLVRKYSSIIPFFSYLTLNNIVTLKCGLELTQTFEMVPFESLGAVSYSLSIVTMSLFCISSKIKPDIGRKLCFCHTPAVHSALLLGGPRRITAIPFGVEKLEW